MSPDTRSQPQAKEATVIYTTRLVPSGRSIYVLLPREVVDLLKLKCIDVDSLAEKKIPVVIEMKVRVEV